LQPINHGRTSFAAHYDFEDRFIYVVGGCDERDQMIRNCEKFDVFNNKWTIMPDMIHERGNPGTMLSNDKRYLYAFQGFINVVEDVNMPHHPLRNKQSKALSTIERIDLFNESRGWEKIELSAGD
jgi:hypothetical protein